MNDITPQRRIQQPDKPRHSGPSKNGARKTAPDKKVIELRLHVPRLQAKKVFRNLLGRIRRLSKRQRLILGLLAVFITAGIVFGIWRLQQSSSLPATTTTPTNPLEQLQKGTPDYPTLLPSGKSADDLGGWTRISPPEREAVYAYVDTINSVPVSVSQQPLPPTFKNDPETKVRDLALAQNADKSLDAGSKKLYIGTSKNGPQSVIFHTDTLLILIKSSSTIPDDAWKTYVDSLQ